MTYTMILLHLWSSSNLILIGSPPASRVVSAEAPIVAGQSFGIVTSASVTAKRQARARAIIFILFY